MSSKKKPKAHGGSADGEDLYLDTLTKDEKEALLNRKMAEIRRKNEERQRRHALIEADRKAAEAKGMAVSLKPPPNATDDNQTPPTARQQLNQEPVKMRGVKVAVETEAETKSAFSTGRGRRLANMKQEAHKSQEKEQRHNNNRKLRPKSQIYDDRSQVQQEKAKRPKSQSFDVPPDVTSHSFLYDDSRQGPLPENARTRSSRNRASYGGEDFSNVRRAMQHEKQRGGGSRGVPIELSMTGRERREYVTWKEERERIDALRLQRAQQEGGWKREWDTDKNIEEPLPPPSRRMEPGKRPAGRIGSGRFSMGEERLLSETQPSQPVAGTRGGGGGARTSGGLPVHDDTSDLTHRVRRDSDDRHVNEKNDSLVIQVVNDFSGEVFDTRGGRGRGSYRGRGRGERGARGGGRGGYRGRGGGEYRPDDRPPYDSRNGDFENRNYPPGSNFRNNRDGQYRDNRYYNDFRDMHRDYPPRGGYRGSRGGDRGYRGGDRGRGGAVGGPSAPRTERKKKGWAEWEAEQAEREAIRAGKKPPQYEPLDTEILGRAIIVTTTGVNRTTETEEEALSPASIQKGDKFSPNKLSGQSGDSWDTTGTEESWETVEGDGDDVEDLDDLADQYEEEDYWDDSLQLQGADEEPQLDEFDSQGLGVGVLDSRPHASEIPEEAQEVTNNAPKVQDAEEETGDGHDIHNSSAESLERFIQEHTLHLNISTGNLETGDTSNEPPNVEATSMVTHEGQKHATNYAVEASDSSADPHNVSTSSLDQSFSDVPETPENNDSVIEETTSRNEEDDNEKDSKSVRFDDENNSQPEHKLPEKVDDSSEQLGNDQVNNVTADAFEEEEKHEICEHLHNQKEAATELESKNDNDMRISEESHQIEPESKIDDDHCESSDAVTALSTDKQVQSTTERVEELTTEQSEYSCENQTTSDHINNKNNDEAEAQR